MIHPDYTSLVILVIILSCPFTSDGHNSDKYYHHPLLSSSHSSNTLQTGRARIWKYEQDVDMDYASATEATEIGYRHRVENKGGINSLHMNSASSTVANYQSSFVTENSHINQSSNPIADSVHGDELQHTLQNLSPPQEYQAHSSFPIECTRSKYRKTGTTIVGCLAQNTLILAADTRATEGSIVADKMCEKVHCLAKNVWACGAGTSGDLDALVKKVRYTFLLRGLQEECIGNGNDENGGESSIDNSVDEFISDEEQSIGITFPCASIAAICHFIQKELYSGGGEIGANLVLGGFDQITQKAVLVAIHPHGSMDLVPYTALGSGGLAAMGVLESRFRIDMTVKEAVKMVEDAVRAGIMNDLGSGSQIDISIISASGVQYVRGLVKEEELILSQKDRNVEEDLFVRHKSSENNNAVMNGVNGFGSLPYWIKSRKLIMESDEKIEQARSRWLGNILKG